jgi:hypothetical protein
MFKELGRRFNEAWWNIIPHGNLYNDLYLITGK